MGSRKEMESKGANAKGNTESTIRSLERNSRRSKRVIEISKANFNSNMPNVQKEDIPTNKVNEDIAETRKSNLITITKTPGSSKELSRNMMKYRFVSIPQSNKSTQTENIISKSNKSRLISTQSNLIMSEEKLKQNGGQIGNKSKSMNYDSTELDKFTKYEGTRLARRRGPRNKEIIGKSTTSTESMQKKEAESILPAKSNVINSPINKPSREGSKNKNKLPEKIINKSDGVLISRNVKSSVNRTDNVTNDVTSSNHSKNQITKGKKNMVQEQIEFVNNDKELNKQESIKSKTSLDKTSINYDLSFAERLQGKNKVRLFSENEIHEQNILSILNKEDINNLSISVEKETLVNVEGITLNEKPNSENTLGELNEGMETVRDMLLLNDKEDLDEEHEDSRYEGIRQEETRSNRILTASKASTIKDHTRTEDESNKMTNKGRDVNKGDRTTTTLSVEKEEDGSSSEFFTPHGSSNSSATGLSYAQGMNVAKIYNNTISKENIVDSSRIKEPFNINNNGLGSNLILEKESNVLNEEGNDKTEGALGGKSGTESNKDDKIPEFYKNKLSLKFHKIMKRKTRHCKEEEIRRHQVMSIQQAKEDILRMANELKRQENGIQSNVALNKLAGTKRGAAKQDDSTRNKIHRVNNSNYLDDFVDLSNENLTITFKDGNISHINKQKADQESNGSKHLEHSNQISKGDGNFFIKNFNEYKKLFIIEVLNVTVSCQRWGKQTFFYNNEMISGCEIFGIITELDIKAEYVKFRVDDSTGSITCLYWYPENSIQFDFELGSYIHLWGNIGLDKYRDCDDPLQLIKVKQFSFISDPNFEAKFVDEIMESCLEI